MSKEDFEKAKLEFEKAKLEFEDAKWVFKCAIEDRVNYLLSESGFSLGDKFLYKNIPVAITNRKLGYNDELNLTFRKIKKDGTIGIPEQYIHTSEYAKLTRLEK